MSIGNISDVLSQVTQIEQQLQQLESGALLDSMLGITSGSSTSSSTSSSSSGSGTSATDFSDALAQAQSPDTSSDDTDPNATAASADGSFGSLASSALASTADTGNDVSTAIPSLTGGVSVASSGATLPASASTLLTAGQQQFASTLSSDTGLSPSVITAWLLAEESGSAAQSRQAAGNNDWLNIGYTDSGTYGASDSVWSDPVTAANATAEWLQGQDSIAGYGTASSGIQDILESVGQTPTAQIQAIQDSGWSSSGYPSLGSLYAQVNGA